jgi:hypothetical protein
MQTQHLLTRAEYERELDAAIAGSFPASDPLPSTLGASPWMEFEAPIPKTGAAQTVTEVIVREGRRVGRVRLAGLGQAIALMPLLPLAILIAGVPVVVLFWGVANVIAWITGNS